jgi:6-phosphofructokinase
MTRTLFVLQGGGPTAVINATLAGIAERAAGRYDRLFGLPHSFEGGRDGSYIDLSTLLERDSNEDPLRRLARTPGSMLGSSRKKVGEKDLARVLELMTAAGSDSLIGIGGNGTMTALNMLVEFAATQGREIKVVGAPKTVDNDLPGVHVAPGYGSAARFVALAVRDFDRDFKAMQTFDDVTILETMGRNTGWIAAASVLLKEGNSAPHMVLLPEHHMDEGAFLENVCALRAEHGRVFIVVNEMLNATAGGLIGESFQQGPTDGLGRKMYSLSLGTGNYLAQEIWSKLGLQTRCLRPGNLGRAMSFCVSEPDRQLALRTGREAVEALQQEDGNRDMITIDADLTFGMRPLEDCTGTRAVPEAFLSDGPVGLTEAFRSYGRALIGSVDSLF